MNNVPASSALGRNRPPWKLQTPPTPRGMALSALLAVLAPGLLAAQESAGITPTLGSPAAIAGIRHYSPGTWSLVSVDVFNSTDQPIDVLASTFFKQHPHLQFGRQLWVPAHARRTVWYPVRPPADASATPGTPLDVETMLYDRTGGHDSLIKSPTGQISRDALLAVGEDDPVTGIIRDGPDDEAQDLVVALRTGKRLSRRVVQVNDLFLPAEDATLDGLRHLVVCSDDIARDAAGLAAVRRWLHRGGQLWLMLDELSEDTVALLLENAYTGQIVDHVELNTVNLQGSGMEFELRSPAAVELERPVRQVRMLAPDLEVAYRVNGWPAALFQPVGRGNVLFTTISPHAWMRVREPADPRPENPADDAPYVARTPLLRLAERFLLPPKPVANPSPGQRAYVTGRVGYEVAPKPLVAAWLGGFCLVLLVAGAGLARMGRLERMAWVTPLAALTACLGLAAVGTKSKVAAEPALSVLQTTQLVPGSEDVQLTGVAALYQRERTDTRLNSRAGAMLLPDMNGMAGGTKRMVWTDIGAWHWENLSVPSGLRLASVRLATRMPRPAFATIHFNEQGLAGQFTQSLFKNVSDAVIGTAGGRWLAVAIDESGRISAGTDDLLPPGEFLSGTLLTEEQRRRQNVYAHQFPVGVETQVLERPTLLAWADAVDLGIELPPGTSAFGSALLSIPLDLQRPQPGAHITIPSPFLDVDAVFGPQSARGSKSTYNRRTGLWLEAIRPSLSWLRFSLPQELQDVELVGGSLSVKIHAPGRPLRILGLTAGQITTLAERNSVVGSFELPLENIGDLDREPEGGLLIGIDVGAFAGAEVDDLQPDLTSLSNTWQVDYVRLDLQARVPER